MNITELVEKAPQMLKDYPELHKCLDMKYLYEKYSNMMNTCYSLNVNTIDINEKAQNYISVLNQVAEVHKNINETKKVDFFKCVLEESPDFMDQVLNNKNLTQVIVNNDYIYHDALNLLFEILPHHVDSFQLEDLIGVLSDEDLLKLSLSDELKPSHKANMMVRYIHRVYHREIDSGDHFIVFKMHLRKYASLYKFNQNLVETCLNYDNTRFVDPIFDYTCNNMHLLNEKWIVRLIKSIDSHRKLSYFQTNFTLNCTKMNAKKQAIVATVLEIKEKLMNK